MNTFLKTHLKLASFSHRIFKKFHDFFGIDFRIDFSSIFHEKGSQNGSKKYMMRETVLLTFRDLLFYVDFMLNLVTILVPFGALWLTLAPFWLTFGALWLTFGALGVTFAHPGARFSHFWCLLASFFIFLCTLGENLM